MNGAAVWGCLLGPALFTSYAVGQTLSASSEVNSTQFGLVGNDAADNTAKLEQMRQYLLRHDGTTVNFAPGIYRYTNMQWLSNVNNVRINGLGKVGFRNVSNNPWDIKKATLLANGDALTGPDSIESGTGATSYPVFTAKAGDTSIRLLSRAPIADISPGTVLLISGYNQQNGGWPPNMRMFEYVTVATVDWRVGIIHLNAPLRHFYYADWPAQLVPPVYGPATIVPLQRRVQAPFQWAESRVFENIEFLANPNGPAYTNDVSGNGLGGLYTFGVRLVQLTNCRLNFLGPNESEWVRVSNSTIYHTELGKLVGTVEFLNSYIENMAAATGLDFLIVRGSTVAGVLDIAPRAVMMTNNTIKSANPQKIFQIGLGTTQYASATHVNTAYIAYNNFVTPPGAALRGLVATTSPRPVTPASISATKVTIPTSTSWAWLGTAPLSGTIFSVSPPLKGTIQAVHEVNNNTVLDITGDSFATATSVYVREVGLLVFFGNSVSGTPPTTNVYNHPGWQDYEQVVTTPMNEADLFPASSLSPPPGFPSSGSAQK